MEIPQGLETEKSLDPRTISYIAQPGKVATTRSREQLLAAGKAKGLSFTEQKEGMISAPIEINGRGQPSIIDFWDMQGRVCKTEFIGSPEATKFEKFTNLYEFDDKGRLVASKQMIKEIGKKERLFRGNEYQYAEDRPDKQYAFIHTDIEGKVETKTYKERLLEKERERMGIIRKKKIGE